MAVTVEHNHNEAIPRSLNGMNYGNRVLISKAKVISRLKYSVEMNDYIRRAEQKGNC